MIVIGYWRMSKKDGDVLPWPEKSVFPFKDKDSFIKKLKFVEANITKLGGRITAYKGISHCRICRLMNGSTEFSLKNFVWPQGYLHYLQKHNVKPDDEFVKFIKSVYSIHQNGD
jgi:hypothetical protein